MFGFVILTEPGYVIFGNGMGILPGSWLALTNQQKSTTIEMDNISKYKGAGPLPERLRGRTSPLSNREFRSGQLLEVNLLLDILQIVPRVALERNHDPCMPLAWLPVTTKDANLRLVITELLQNIPLTNRRK